MPVPGRNEPCSCGSGRKYKYCCLHFAPRQEGTRIEFAPQDEFAFNEDGPAAQMMREFLAQRGDKNFESMEALQSELKAFSQRDNCKPKKDFEGLSSEQMNAVLYAPLNSPGIIRIAERVKAGTNVPVLMMLDELRQAIETGRGVSCTRARALPPKLVAHLYKKFRMMRPFDGLLETERIRKETDAPVVHTTRNVLEVSGHLRTYAGKFILSRSCRKQFSESGYAAIYPEIFRSYALDFNWSYWPSLFRDDPFQFFFCFTLFQLSKRGHEFVAPARYGARFYDAFPTLMNDLVGEDDSPESFEYLITLYMIHVVINFWGFFGLVEFADSDPDSEDMPLVRATPLLRELIQFPEEWFAQI